MSNVSNDTSNGAKFEIDVSAQDLVDKYGIEEDAAKRIVADLPDLAEEWLKDEDQETGVPKYPEFPKTGKYPVDQFAKRVAALLKKAGMSGEMQTKVMEAISVDDVQEFMDVMEAISVDKPMLAKLKKVLRRAKLPKEWEVKVMEAISVDEADWVSFAVLEGDVQEAISVDNVFKEKLMKILRKAKLPKEWRINVMEAISVEDSVDETAADQLRTEAQRAMAHFKISVEEWNKLSEEEKAAKIKELPKRGSAYGDQMNEMTLTEEQKTKLTEMGLGPVAEAQVLLYGSLDRPDKLGFMQGKYPGPGAIDTKGAPYWDSLDFEFVEDSFDVKDGGLKAHAICAAAMVQDYNGTKILKCPDELKLAVSFARMLPITDGHPPGALVRDQNEIKGWTDLLTWNDEKKRIETDITITDSKLIEKIQKDGLRDVSIGFFCDLDHKKGVFKDADGKALEYDAIQRNLVLNHLAAGVKQGRCPAGVCGIGQDSAGVPGEDADASTHEKLLREKVDAIKALGNELAAKASTIKPEEISAKCSQMSDIAWRIREMTDVINTKGISVGDAILKEAKEAVDSAQKVINDSKGEPKKDENELALQVMAEEKARVIDSIMDMEPPRPRNYFEDMNIITLKDLKTLMDSQKDGEGIKILHSKKAGQDAINDAYDRLFGQ